MEVFNIQSHYFVTLSGLAVHNNHDSVSIS